MPPSPHRRPRTPMPISRKTCPRSSLPKPLHRRLAFRRTPLSRRDSEWSHPTTSSGVIRLFAINPHIPPRGPPRVLAPSHLAPNGPAPKTLGRCAHPLHAPTETDDPKTIDHRRSAKRTYGWTSAMIDSTHPEGHISAIITTRPASRRSSASPRPS